MHDVIAVGRTVHSNALRGLLGIALAVGSLGCPGTDVTNVSFPTLAVSTTGMPTAVTNVAYAESLQATGGDGLYSWSIVEGTLPAGLSLLADGGISGTPSVAGGASFRVQVQSGDGQTADRTLTMTVETPALAVTTGVLPNGVENTDYGTVPLAATGGTGTYAWAIASGTLPAGLSLSTSGDITGLPTTSGTSDFTVEVTSGSDTAQRALSIVVTQPSAATTLLVENFDDGNAAARGWFDNTNFTVTTAEKVSGPSSLELRFTPGSTTTVFGGAARILFTDTESVFVSYWVKYSTNWVGSGGSDHPHELYLLTNVDDEWIGPSQTHLTFYIEHNYQIGLVPRLMMQDGLNIDQSQIGVDLTGVTEARAAAGCNGNGDPYQGGCYSLGGGVFNNEKVWDAAQPGLVDQPGPLYKNDWHFVEAYVELNTIQGGVGQADGILQYSIDGTLMIDVQDALIRTGAHPTMAFRELLIGPYIGGGSPVDQTAWIDDLRVADGR